MGHRGVLGALADAGVSLPVMRWTVEARAHQGWAAAAAAVKRVHWQGWGHESAG